MQCAPSLISPYLKPIDGLRVWVVGPYTSLTHIIILKFTSSINVCVVSFLTTLLTSAQTTSHHQHIPLSTTLRWSNTWHKKAHLAHFASAHRDNFGTMTSARLEKAQNAIQWAASDFCNHVKWIFIWCGNEKFYWLYAPAAALCKFLSISSLAQTHTWGARSVEHNKSGLKTEMRNVITLDSFSLRSFLLNFLKTFKLREAHTHCFSGASTHSSLY